MNRMRMITGLACVAGALTIAVSSQAFSTYAKWPSTSAIFYMNPANLDVDSTSAENAFKLGLNAWSTEAKSNFRYVYGGRVSDTTTGYDSRNVVLLRNASNGSALASTYTWWSGSTIVDSDIVVWDGAFRFFAGASGCTNGAYLEDVLTHELGHALGLNHSSDAAATMYPSYSFCSTALRTLAADDIAGAQSLYGVAASTNTAPTLTITSPTGGTFSSTTSIAFTGSATDSQDGTLTSRMVWTSSLSGQIGTGGSFSRTLPAGTHDITAKVSDSGGLSVSKHVTITVGSSSTTAQPTLTAKGYVYGTGWRVDLTWTGFKSQSVDVLKNGVWYTVTTNDGATKYSIYKAGTYRWKLCAAGTSTCSNEVSVTF